jgi:hypothetical protein
VGYLVIKTLAYFPLQCALNSGPVMNAVLDSAASAGIKTQENSMSADAAVIWSVLWNGRMAANQAVYRYYRAQNKPVIIVEVGALYRGHTWKIAVNHITSAGYYGHTENLDWDRPVKLNISLATQFTYTDEIVIAAQHPRSLQTENVDVSNWVHQQIANVRSVSNRPIVVRPHPRARLQLTELSQDVKVVQPQKLINTYDSYDMHYRCHAVINYNSGPGIQAAVAGCRPLVDSSSLATPVAVDLNDIEKPYDIDRTQWLVEICHTEYTVEEIIRGIWLKRIRPALQVP